MAKSVEEILKQSSKYKCVLVPLAQEITLDDLRGWVFIQTNMIEICFEYFPRIYAKMHNGSLTNYILCLPPDDIPIYHNLELVKNLTYAVESSRVQMKELEHKISVQGSDLNSLTEKLKEAKDNLLDKIKSKVICKSVPPARKLKERLLKIVTYITICSLHGRVVGYTKCPYCDLLLTD